MSSKQFAFFDGRGMKTISIAELDTWTRVNMIQNGQGNGNADALFGDVAWMFRAVMLRVNEFAAMPFEVLRGDEVIDSSDDYQNAVEFLPDPIVLFKQMQASLTMTGTAYLLPQQNRYAKARNTLSELQYAAPQTMRPEYNPRTGALLSYKRAVNTETLTLAPENVFAFWYPDYAVELGPPKHFPARAACKAAGVLYNLDVFLEMFAARGMVKSMLVALAGNPPKDERTRFETILENALSGIRNAWNKMVVSADSVTVIPVGEGIKDLQNTELTTSERDAIAAAMTIPVTKLFSGSAAGLGGGSVTDADDLRFLQEFTLPEWKWFASQFNKLIMQPLGYRLRPKPETLNALQEDEVARMSAVETLNRILNESKTRAQFEFAMKVNGAEWDASLDPLLNSIFAAKAERQDAMQEQLKPAPANMTVTKPEPKLLEDSTQSAAKALERKQFKAWSAKRDANEWHKFQFKFLGDAEQFALGVKVALKSVDAVATQFCARWTDRIRQAFRDDTANLENDLREMLEYHVSSAYFEGLQEAGVLPEDFTDEDYQNADTAYLEQTAHLTDFVSAILDAVENIDAREAVLARAELWCNSIAQIGANARRAAMGGMFEFRLVGEPSDESCATCEKLLGKKHRWSWIEKNGYIVAAGNPNFECGCYRCPHSWEPVE